MMRQPHGMLSKTRRIIGAIRHKPTIHLGLWWLGWARAESQTSEAERECLARHAGGKKCLAEIGVWHGMTTCRLRRVMAPEGILMAVDPYLPGKLGFSAQQVIAHREVSRVRHGTVNWLRTTGSEAARHLPSTIHRTFDFVFIDGLHSYEGLREDWEGWAELVAPGGIIALHDSRSSSARRIDDLGSVRFTRDVIVRDIRFQVIETVDSLTVLQKQ
jgi:predicted O-methyltransferase YrrM